MKKLSILLRSNKRYLLLFVFVYLISLIYSTVYISNHQFYEGRFNQIIEVQDYKVTEVKTEVKTKDGIYSFYGQINHISFGARLKVRGYYKAPIKNTVPNLFNYHFYLKSNKITKYAVIEEYNVLEEVKSIKHYLRNLFFEYTNQLKGSAYYQALILGHKHNLDKEVKSLYQRVGVSHLLSLSGLHVGLLAVVVSSILSKVIKYREIADLVVILILLSYANLTFSSVSIYRAVMMFSILRLNHTISLSVFPIDTLFISGVILLCVNPLEVFQVGFYFSFIIVFFILMAKAFIQKGNTFLKALKLSVICFLASLPIILMINYEINLITPIANLVIIPIFSILIYPLTLISFCLPFLNDVFAFAIIVFNQIVAVFDLSQLNLIIGKPSLILILCYYLLLILSFVYSKPYVIIMLTMFLISPHLNFNYNIYYLDVGQGDSTIITTPFLREVYIIDTGGIYYKKESYEISRYKTIPLLKSLGVRKVTALILTHGDFDHLGEAEYLLNHYNIKSLILNCNNRNEIENDLFFSYYKRVKDPANLRKLELLSCRTFDDENDSSLSFKLNAFHSTLYFGGDLPNWYQDRYTFKIDFLKLSHHGSKTSTSEHFIENTKPIYAIASLKKNNMYGHPHQKVIEILKKYNVKLYRTDHDGTIYLRISPFGYQLKSFPPN